MAKFVKGEVVIIPFPFSDLTGSKKRPALVLSDLDGDDTSQNSRDKFAVSLTSSDFVSGSLPVDSFIRPSCTFTADKDIIIRKAGLINSSKINAVIQKIIDIIK
ncbi:type II toxin-antitoxin system PemK/MazF family toxin [Dyadobacter flavalbus]|uniref:Type II toxin-antitoxin system PemK/MazF family toxin n=1 Tax=Dyadobacter flavalbus TaxID=2579942 RepID=A0A5M8R191_9BACT|nr:type II toxin-antitoxin system PemK/MazF family toxin [Dyadobacter flavalbus]KAA6440744.1 type II toxin-antitoxin system PemK/MazF family toxin [Dyadobacter flavalbus]